MSDLVSFTSLKVWQKGHELVVAIYLATKSFPNSEIYGLTSQMRRAAVSVTSNIAEGFGRSSRKEKLRFYVYSRASLTELKNQLLVARDIAYLNEKDFRDLADKANQTHKILHALIKSVK